MELEKLNNDEEPLSREDLLRIKGGASAIYSVYITYPCDATGSSQVTDCADMSYD